MSFTALKTIRPFFTNDCGRLLSGGKVYSYEPGTLTLKATYKDAAGLTENTNPIILDASGEADIYINSDYRFQIFDRDGVLIDDVDLVAATQRVSSEFVLDASGLTQGQINNEVRLEQGQALTPTAAWPDVLSLVNQGGTPSIHDVPIQALLNRIQKLYEDAVVLSNAVADRYTKTETDAQFVESAEKGVANGVATLDVNIKVPVVQQYTASTIQPGIVQLVNDLTTGGTDKALTAEQGKLFFSMFSGGTNHFRIPNPSSPSTPWIVQFATVTQTTNPQTITFPVAFPTTCVIVLPIDAESVATAIRSFGTNALSATSFAIVAAQGATAATASQFQYVAIGY